MNGLKIAGIILLGFFVVFAIGFAATGGDLLTYKFFAPKYANAQREVFQNSTSFVQGKAEYIGKLRYQYLQADGAQKDALKSLILSEASTVVDKSQLPPDIQGFVRTLEGGY